MNSYIKFCIITFITIDSFCSQHFLGYTSPYTAQIITQNFTAQNQLLVPYGNGQNQVFIPLPAAPITANQHQSLTPVYNPENTLPKKDLDKISEEINNFYKKSLVSSLFIAPSAEQSYQTILIAQKHHLTLEELRDLKKQNSFLKQAITNVKDELLLYIKTSLHKAYIREIAQHISSKLPAALNQDIKTYIMHKAYKTDPFDYKIVLPHTSQVTAYDFCLEHNLFVTLTEENKIWLWNLITGNYEQLTTLSELYQFIRLSPDGKYTVMNKKIMNSSYVPSVEVWNNKEKRKEYSWTTKKLPTRITDIICAGPDTIIVRGKDKPDGYLSDYFLNRNSPNPIIKKTLAIITTSSIQYSNNPKMVSFDDVGCIKKIFIPKKSPEFFLLNTTIKNSPAQSNLEEIKTTPEYARLHLIEKELINKLIEDKKKGKTFLSSLSETFSSAKEEPHKGYGIL